MSKFSNFSRCAHQAHLEHHQGHVQLYDKFPYHGARDVLLLIYTTKLEYLTLELKFRRTSKQTEKADITKKKYFLTGKFNKKNTINTRFERRCYTISAHSLTLQK